MDRDEVLDALAELAEALEALSQAVWRVVELGEADDQQPS